jgi:hypothetical protein
VCVKGEPICDPIPSSEQSRGLKPIIHTYIRPSISIHSFIRSFVHSFTRSLAHSLTRSPAHPLTRSPVHPFIRSSIHSFIHSFIRSSAHSIAWVCDGRVVSKKWAGIPPATPTSVTWREGSVSPESPSTRLSKKPFSSLAGSDWRRPQRPVEPMGYRARLGKSPRDTNCCTLKAGVDAYWMR